MKQLEAQLEEAVKCLLGEGPCYDEKQGYCLGWILKPVPFIKRKKAELHLFKQDNIWEQQFLLTAEIM